MQLIAYLNFDGNCRAAFDFYRESFKGEITMRMTYGDSPMRDDMPADSHGLIMHCQLEAGGAVLMAPMGRHRIPPAARAPASIFRWIRSTTPSASIRLCQIGRAHV